jgi:predicted RNA binding protein YcfA (HicA-like mRNA interferase family)
MAYPRNIWNQLKNLTAKDLIKALEKDGWIRDEKAGQAYVYVNLDGKRRVTIHFHPQKTYQPKLLQGLLADIGWTEDEMRELKLIK